MIRIPDFCLLPFMGEKIVSPLKEGRILAEQSPAGDSSPAWKEHNARSIFGRDNVNGKLEAHLISGRCSALRNIDLALSRKALMH